MTQVLRLHQSLFNHSSCFFQKSLEKITVYKQVINKIERMQKEQKNKTKTKKETRKKKKKIKETVY